MKQCREKFNKCYEKNSETLEGIRNCVIITRDFVKPALDMKTVL